MAGCLQQFSLTELPAHAVVLGQQSMPALYFLHITSIIFNGGCNPAAARAIGGIIKPDFQAYRGIEIILVSRSKGKS